MNGRLMKKALILLVALVFAMVSTLALAEAKQWYVNKNKLGRCSVLQLKAKTDKTIAGPFATKEEAAKAKEKMCPKKDSKQKSQ